MRRYSDARGTPRARQATALPTQSLNSRAALISSPRRSGCSESGCPTTQPLFLNLDDQLGVLQLLRQAGICGLQFAVLLHQWTDNHLGATLLGRQSVELALLALLSPCGQVRGVEALPAQQGAHRAGTLS